MKKMMLPNREPLLIRVEWILSSKIFKRRFRIIKIYLRKRTWNQVRTERVHFHQLRQLYKYDQIHLYWKMKLT